MRVKFHDDHRLRFFVGCVRDKERLKVAMNGVDLVIHAAALKRIEVGAYNPTEMVNTNVLGSMNVIDASVYNGVKSVIFLSTDKAFQPISPYGCSKALAEQLFLSSNNMYGMKGPKFSVTRYGNVAGSTGSVIPIWREAIAKKKAIKVTDPDCTRFWMYMSEAISLVVDTIVTMPTKPVIPILPAYRLGDLAMAMGINNYERIGLFDYEKKHESMGEGNSSDLARRLSVKELRSMLTHV